MGSSVDTAWRHQLLCLALLQGLAIEGGPEIRGLVFSVWVESVLDVAPTPYAFSLPDGLLVVERTVDHIDDVVPPSRSHPVGHMGLGFRTIESGAEGCCKVAVLLDLVFGVDTGRDCFGCCLIDDD